jgi:hypothetical protein
MKIHRDLNRTLSEKADECTSVSISRWVLIVVLAAVALGSAEPVAAQAESVLYSFAGGADGGAPQSKLLLDAKGNLYGTAPLGGRMAQELFSGST